MDRAFFEPDVHCRPEHACPGYSIVVDQIAHVAHLNVRDTTLAPVSRAQHPNIEQLKERIGWDAPWCTLIDNFDADFNIDEWNGTNSFIPHDGANQRWNTCPLAQWSRLEAGSSDKLRPPSETS